MSDLKPIGNVEISTKSNLSATSRKIGPVLIIRSDRSHWLSIKSDNHTQKQRRDDYDVVVARGLMQ